MTASDPVLYDLNDGVAVLRLNRPEVMNALNGAMRQALIAAITRANAEARAIVLTGVGRAFCSGQDLLDAGNLDAVDFERILREEYEPMLRALYDCPLPTIAAVNGAAAGAGANLALAADVVIAAESASFIQAFARIGLVPDAGGTWWLPRQVGFARAMGAMLFADKITARQAVDWGMIWECVEDVGFDAQWRARAAALANGPTLALSHTKALLRGSYDNSLDQQLAQEARSQGVCGQTCDFREGVQSFLEKRPARFEGR